MLDHPVPIVFSRNMNFGGDGNFDSVVVSVGKLKEIGNTLDVPISFTVSKYMYDK